MVYINSHPYETTYNHDFTVGGASIGMVPGMITTAGLAGPWSHPRILTTVGSKSYRFDSKGFTAYIDCQLFDKGDITVKTIGHTIAVECKHESKEDGHGFIERRLVRKFFLPSEYNMSTIKSTLMNDGVLHLEAPKPVGSGEEVHLELHHSEKPSLLMSLLNRALSIPEHSHSIPIDAEA